MRRRMTLKREKKSGVCILYSTHLVSTHTLNKLRCERHRMRWSTRVHVENDPLEIKPSQAKWSQCDSDCERKLEFYIAWTSTYFVVYYHACLPIFFSLSQHSEETLRTVCFPSTLIYIFFTRSTHILFFFFFTLRCCWELFSSLLFGNRGVLLLLFVVVSLLPFPLLLLSLVMLLSRYSYIQ